MISDELMKKYNLPTFDEWGAAIEAGVYEDYKDLYQMFLSATDHIPLKIFESFVEDMAAASIVGTIGVIIDFFKNVKGTYNDVLMYRKMAREEINKEVS